MSFGCELILLSTIGYSIVLYLAKSGTNLTPGLLVNRISLSENGGQRGVTKTCILEELEVYLASFGQK
jgi:hypothetical protein